ncbi:TRAP transporter small permease subunit [Laribacter hongkongensis]|uniref:TRAP transporter small permease subunit n=1 Tax=Laribacter hongkongensis TaxID=168471 RepID=UPI001EFEB5A8|nr:TRAP transporter small permease subunit [Laribacter hongkongensis]MCG9065564.1 TRAP transporter small permease subunit [Laribacter hongkongensis]
MHSALCLSRLIDALNDKVGRLLMWLILFMTLLSTGNALIRKFFDYSSNGLLEAQWYMFSAVFLLGGAHVLLHNEHIRIDLLASRYSPQTRAWIDIFGTLMFLLPTVTMVLWLALPGFLESFRLQEVSANPGGLLLWPAKLLIPAGFILLLLQAVSEIIKRIAFLLGRIDDPLEKHVQPTAEENLIAELKRREDATPKGAAA